MWKTTSPGTFLGTRELATNIDAMAFSPSGNIIACGCVDGTISLLDLGVQPRNEQLPKHGSTLNTITFSVDGNAIASLSEDGAVGVWDVSSGRLQLRYMTKARLGFLPTLVFSPDGITLASTAQDAAGTALVLRDVITGSILLHFYYSGKATAIAFSHDGTMVAIAFDEHLEIWNVKTRALHRTLCGVKEGLAWRTHVTSIEFSPDGQLLASNAPFESRLWDVQSSVLIETLPIKVIPEPNSINLQRPPIRFKIKTKQEPYLAVNIGPDNEECYLWDQSKKVFNKVTQDNLPSHQIIHAFKDSFFSIDQSNTWLKLGAAPAIWLPPNARPTRLIESEPLSTYGCKVAIGSTSGEVLLLQISKDWVPKALGGSSDDVVAEAWQAGDTQAARKGVSIEDL